MSMSFLDFIIMVFVLKICYLFHYTIELRDFIL